jgi:hypothetical protein
MWRAAHPSWAVIEQQLMSRVNSIMTAPTTPDVLTARVAANLAIKPVESIASVFLAQIIDYTLQVIIIYYYFSDVDECKNRNICGANAKCVNSNGGYQCDCKNGYEKIEQSPKSRCKDANECLFGRFPCGANAKCINTDGGYKCLCKDGFVGNATIGCKCKSIEKL